jgi:choline dehydrogenase-like flavoprotein
VQEDLQTQYIDPALHGSNGPIWNTFPDIYGPLDEAWPRAYENLGIGVKSDPRDGLALGGYTNLINMDLDGRKRSYAATGYYLPASKRPNLTVLTGAYVKKIILERMTHGSGVKATGVKYSLGLNLTILELVEAEKEVILCAGSIGSPQVLELSGTGDPKILSKYDIEVVVPNPNVGENLQDHIYVPIG